MEERKCVKGGREGHLGASTRTESPPYLTYPFPGIKKEGKIEEES